MDEESDLKFWKSLVTDYDGKTFETGRALVVIVTLSMAFFQGWDIIVHNAKFDPASFGTGVAAILAGLGAYVFGDNSKRPTIPPIIPKKKE